MSRNVKGLDELSKKLVELGAKMGKKTLSAATRDAIKPVVQEMKARAPVGGKPHKTHKGRLVAPGFLRRSIKTRSRFKKGRVEVHVGVLSEAFYGVQFLDQGISVSARRGKENKAIKPYTLKGSKFFKLIFLKHQNNMVDIFADRLRQRIKKVAA